MLQSIEKLLPYFCQLIFRKIIKIVTTEVRFNGLNAPNSILAKNPPQTPLGELMLPQTFNLI